MGRYYPPSTTSAPTFNKTSHPLGARARKLPQGILTVRFEMPFAVWCAHCNPPAIIGQGVRFNAEKKKVGMYHSTPIWSFRMKHTACGGWMEIRTDPASTEYVVAEGGKRRDYGEEGRYGGVGVGVGGEGEGKILSVEERERRRVDAFAALEGRVGEKGERERWRERVEELWEAQEKAWRDPYEVNRRLRREFREEKRGRERVAAEKEALREKFGVGFEIVDEVEADGVRAGLVEFGASSAGDRDVERAARKPLFDVEPRLEKRSVKESVKGVKKTRAEKEAEKRRDVLQLELRGNTRAAMDPFLVSGGRSADKGSAGRVIVGLKRKRKDEAKDEDHTGVDTGTAIIEGNEKARTVTMKPSLPLVDYDSD
ncbi:hypothetical protein K432DRAFT_409244 [Lepidopterella palustris CBS 459.81]|uniref:DUF572-domain-containing protein n=1 Tax=Lepidopterella palustris CBS 459.81 TaxID=1314670 RepID=A0A8E2E0P3_9PEZI|nr:hypothetical protein K432DRAFT_409244 [Lepidopterella palustris CBS 459.81]